MAEAHRDEIAKLEALYASNPEGRVFTHLAEAYRKAGDLELAAQVLEQGLERHPDSASGFIVLGRVHFDRGERQRAAGAFRRALELDSGNLVAHRLLGELALDQDAPDEALRHYRELLDRNPGDASLQEQVDALSHPSGPAGEPEAPTLAAVDSRGEEPWAASGGEPPGPERYGELSGVGSLEEPVRYDAGVRPEPDVVEEPPPPDFAAAMEPPPVEPYGHDAYTAPEAAAYPAPEAPAQPWEQGMLAEIPEGDDAVPGDAVERADLLTADLSLESVSLEAEEEYADLPPLEVAAYDERQEYADLPPLETGLLPDEVLLEGAGEDTGLAALEPVGFAPWEEPDEEVLPLGMYDEERAAAQEREPGEPEPGAAEAGAGLVTETMAELYRSQGFHARAADVYRSLLRERSEDERLRLRLAEVEAELAASAERRERATPDPESVESAFTGGSGAAGEEETPYAWSTADEVTGAGVAIGDYFRGLLSWRGAAPAEAADAAVAAPGADTPEEPTEFWLEQPADAGWGAEGQGGADADGPEDLVLESADEAAWTPEPAVNSAGDSGWTPDELMREPAEPMPWDAAPAGEAAASAPGADGDLMPWELPEPPGLEPHAAVEETAARDAAAEAPAGAAAEAVAGDAEGEDDEDEDLEMFRSWLQSLKK